MATKVGDDVPTTLKAYVAQWEEVFERRGEAVVVGNDDDEEDANGEGSADPFDCCSSGTAAVGAAVPATTLTLHRAVDDVLDKFVDEWKDLDDRKVVREYYYVYDAVDDRDNLAAAGSATTGTGDAHPAEEERRRRRRQQRRSSCDGAEGKEEGGGSSDSSDDEPVRKVPRRTSEGEEQQKQSPAVAGGDAAAVAAAAAHDSAAAANTASGEEKEETKKPLPGWYKRFVRLPENFDYATRRSSPPTDDEGEDQGGKSNEDRVVSLEDPTKTRSYNAELWELFRRVPTLEQIERQLIEDGAVDKYMPRVCQLSRNELPTAVKRYHRSDAHAMGRLRMCDRHEYPPTQHAPPPSPPPPLVATIRFECWKRELKRGSSPE